MKVKVPNVKSAKITVVYVSYQTNIFLITERRLNKKY